MGALLSEPVALTTAIVTQHRFGVTSFPRAPMEASRGPETVLSDENRAPQRITCARVIHRSFAHPAPRARTALASAVPDQGDRHDSVPR